MNENVSLLGLDHRMRAVVGRAAAARHSRGAIVPLFSNVGGVSLLLNAIVPLATALSGYERLAMYEIANELEGDELRPDQRRNEGAAEARLRRLTGSRLAAFVIWELGAPDVAGA